MFIYNKCLLYTIYIYLTKSLVYAPGTNTTWNKYSSIKMHPVLIGKKRVHISLIQIFEV